MADDEEERPKRAKRTLPWLPGHDAPLGEVRDWLTVALGFPPGFYVEDFIRHGRGRTDGCELIVSAPGGRRVGYEIDEQRLLSVPASLRATIAAQTDGLARSPARIKGELEDVWLALVILASVTVQQTKTDETRDWLDRFLRITTDMAGHTLENRDAQFDALQAWRERPDFERASAQHINDLRDHERPVQLVDSQTGRRYVRSSDVATFVRHVIASGPISQPSLNARMAGIGVEVLTFEVRRGDEHPRLTLYRLPTESPEGDDGDRHGG